VTTHDDGIEPYGLAEHEKMRADARLAGHYRQQIETLEGELVQARAEVEKLRAREARVWQRIETWQDDPETRLQALALGWDRIERAEAERDAMRPVVDALAALVALRDGPRDAEYERLKPLAWSAAKTALAAVDQMATPDLAGPADTGALSSATLELVAAATADTRGVEVSAEYDEDDQAATDDLPAARDGGVHAYLSTACRHAAEPGREPLHLECQTGGKRWDGTEKLPASCKWCGASCVCACHAAAPTSPLAAQDGEAVPEAGSEAPRRAEALYRRLVEER
jgi:hypothetical protein